MKLLITLAFVLSGFFHNNPILKPNTNCDIYINISMFWQTLSRVETFAIWLIFSGKFLPQVHNTFLRWNVHLAGRQKLILCEALKYRKHFFGEFAIPQVLTLKSDSHVSENFCQIKIFPSLVQKNTIICLFDV